MVHRNQHGGIRPLVPIKTRGSYLAPKSNLQKFKELFPLFQTYWKSMVSWPLRTKWPAWSSVPKKCSRCFNSAWGPTPPHPQTTSFPASSTSASRPTHPGSSQTSTLSRDSAMKINWGWGKLDTSLLIWWVWYHFIILAILIFLYHSYYFF